jgi:hypothetical protein
MLEMIERVSLYISTLFIDKKAIKPDFKLVKPDFNMWGHMQRDKDSTTEMTPQHLEQA